jgi:hypothetical protein
MTRIEDGGTPWGAPDRAGRKREAHAEKIHRSYRARQAGSGSTFGRLSNNHEGNSVVPLICALVSSLSDMPTIGGIAANVRSVEI